MGKRGPQKSKPEEVEAAKLLDERWERVAGRAERVKTFMESLQVTSGLNAGGLFQLAQWEIDAIDALYKVDENGVRKVRQSLITMPRKNGKTGFIAGLCLAHLCGPEAESYGEIYSAAAEREQAAIIFRMMKSIINADEALARRLTIREFDRSVEDIVTGSMFKALSADAGTKHGLSASLVVYDELAQAKDRKLFDVLATSGGARREPLMIVISTQSPDSDHVMSEMVNYGQQVLDGVIEDEYFYPIIYQAPEAADIWDEEVWKACNPGMPEIRSIDEMRVQANQARAVPGREAAFRNLYLNQRVDPEATFLSVSEWEKCGKEIDMKTLKGKPCYAGLDLADTRDLNALALYFPEDNTALAFTWIARGQIDHQQRSDRVPYRLWVDQGWMTPTEGNAVNKRDIAKFIKALQRQFQVVKLAYDPWGIVEFQRLLVEEDVKIPLEKFGQRYSSMSPAIAELERLVVERELTHNNNPVLNWAFSNITIETDMSGHRKFMKGAARDRIDPMIALVMAIGTANVTEGYTRFDASWIVSLDN